MFMVLPDPRSAIVRATCRESIKTDVRYHGPAIRPGRSGISTQDYQASTIVLKV
jgi:hypothetical protein